MKLISCYKRDMKILKCGLVVLVVTPLWIVITVIYQISAMGSIKGMNERGERIFNMASTPSSKLWTWANS